jgi:hypothetical protein
MTMTKTKAMDDDVQQILTRIFRDSFHDLTVMADRDMDRDDRDDRVRRLTGIDLRSLRVNLQPGVSPDHPIGMHPSGEWIRLRDLTRDIMIYIEYIRSREWHERAAIAKAAVKFSCQMCGCDWRPVEVHHIRYDHLGHEPASDLLVLCEECHGRHHRRFELPREQQLLPFTPTKPRGSDFN